MANAPHSAPPPPLTVAQMHTRPVAIAWRAMRRWWHGVRREIDQERVIEKVQADSGFTPRYAFMTAMSAGIAILGLLLSSPAVVIGAMLLSPLMGPILGAGFALAIGDARWLRQSAWALFWGVAVAILFCALIVALSPLQTVTAEIAARTRPNLFDLLVAFFSALAGAYAMIRGREGTIVGVAIATALMPPLAVVGFGLATFNWTVFGGSLLLFFTNLMTIALTAAIMARLYGFSTGLSPTQTHLQTAIIVAVFIALAVPLGLSLAQIAKEATASRAASAAVQRIFGEEARVSAIDYDFDAEPIALTASVLTPRTVAGAEAEAARVLSEQLGEPVSVRINQYRVGVGEGDAESAELAAARIRAEQQADDRRVEALAQRLALIAGVPASAVTVDRSARRAAVRAAALPGASLATWRSLEARVAASEPGWSIAIRPPALPLPTITMGDDGPDESGQRALALAAWAGKRVDAPIGVGGPADAAASVAALLTERGTVAVARPGGAAVTLRWLPPDALAEETPAN